jgi:hypothetical protein
VVPSCRRRRDGVTLKTVPQLIWQLPPVPPGAPGLMSRNLLRHTPSLSALYSRPADRAGLNHAQAEDCAVAKGSASRSCPIKAPVASQHHSGLRIRAVLDVEVVQYGQHTAGRLRFFELIAGGLGAAKKANRSRFVMGDSSRRKLAIRYIGVGASEKTGSRVSLLAVGAPASSGKGGESSPRTPIRISQLAEHVCQ